MLIVSDTDSEFDEKEKPLTKKASSDEEIFQPKPKPKAQKKKQASDSEEDMFENKAEPVKKAPPKRMNFLSSFL